MSRRNWVIVACVLMSLGAAALWWTARRDEPNAPSPDDGAGGRRVAAARRWSPFDDELRGATPARPAAGGERGDSGIDARDELLASALAAYVVTTEDGGWSALRTRVSETRSSVWLERNADLAERTVDAFCREAAKLKKHSLFTSGTERDASAFLAPLIDWEVKPGQRPVRGALALPRHLDDRMRNLETGAWLYALSASDATGLDFSWMQQAQQFDHWDLSKEPRFTEDHADYFTATTPNFFVFFQWAKLRLAVALQQGDATQAAAEVRHLADLCVSTGLVIGMAIGIALRSIENIARQAAVLRGQDVSAWPEASEAQRLAFRRVVLPSTGFFYPGVSERVMRKAAACAGPERCMLLAEGLGAHRSLGEYASASNPAALDALIRESHCSGAPFDRARASPVATSAELDEVLSGEPLLGRFLDAGAP